MTTTVDPHRRAGTAHVLADIVIERRRQTAKHGDQTDLPDGTGPDVELIDPVVPVTFAHLATYLRDRTDERSRSSGDGSVTFADVLLEEVFEALCEVDPVKLRAELVQVAAVAVQWVEAIDARPAATS